MHALLIISHGSRRAQSNDEVVQLCQLVSEHVEGDFDLVRAAFLELASPSIPEGIKRCVDDGAECVTIVPYFLAAGRHVAEDIPSIVNAARVEFPETMLSIAPHLGAFEGMARMLAEVARAQGGGRD
ncbi:MAG: CbiX/SirB N-terminal domain-containing protein [Gammaproteobacteria bacterium]|nr:CbiX/SirB N-terminal domain-containing protein [Gammaproteobacteria bacterium]